MSVESKEKRQAIPAKEEPQKQENAIAERVIRVLGRPRDLHRVQVNWLFGDHYRVNVFVGGDATSARIVHSYFLTADGEGNITACRPEVTRQY